MPTPSLENTHALFATALRETWRKGYRLTDLRSDILAGITVGIVAVPLAMALAIASGVPPQHGLYTAIIAGLVIGLLGGSRVSISGPTAAFVVILLPITHRYGLGGLLMTTVMAGMLLMAMGLARMGRLIQFIPYPVTTGFTAGIAVVIATLQIKDFFGLQSSASPEHYLDRLQVLFHAWPSWQLSDSLLGLLTLAILLLWPRLKTAIPAYLAALVLGTLLAVLGAFIFPDFHYATISTRFSFNLDGLSGNGIPPMAPRFVLPWLMPDATGQPIGLSWSTLHALLPAAFTVAMLGAIESLLCAVVADGLSGMKHNPNGELIGQGLGNVIAPFFGGITATAALARTATNIRAGGRSPVAALVHALVVLLTVVMFATLLGYVPMAALAALLLVVAWNMSEAGHFVHIIKAAPRNDVAVLLVCFGLTVLFDMVLAVGVGVVLASVLFIHRMTDLTGASPVDGNQHEHLKNLPEHIAVYEIKGPLFFGAAEKAISVLHRFNSRVQVLIVDMANVPAMDMTGIVALQSLLLKLAHAKVAVVITGLAPNIQRKLLRAGIRRRPGLLAFANNLKQGRAKALQLRPVVATG